MAPGKRHKENEMEGMEVEKFSLLNSRKMVFFGDPPREDDALLGILQDCLEEIVDSTDDIHLKKCGAKPLEFRSYITKLIKQISGNSLQAFAYIRHFFKEKETITPQKLLESAIMYSLLKDHRSKIQEKLREVAKIRKDYEYLERRGVERELGELWRNYVDKHNINASRVRNAANEIIEEYNRKIAQIKEITDDYINGNKLLINYNDIVDRLIGSQSMLYSKFMTVDEREREMNYNNSFDEYVRIQKEMNKCAAEKQFLDDPYTVSKLRSATESDVRGYLNMVLNKIEELKPGVSQPFRPSEFVRIRESPEKTPPRGDARD